MLRALEPLATRVKERTVNLTELLQPSRQAALVPPSGPSVSFAELHTRVDAFAGGLFDLGVRPGDRVVVLVEMSVELSVALLGLLRVGATAVLVDPSADLQPLLERVRPVGMVGSPAAHLLRLRHPALRGLGLTVSTGFTPLPHRRLDRVVGQPPPADDGAAPALMTFTTGTTGPPKCIVRSHAFMLAQHRALSEHMDLGPDDVDLPTLPVFLLHSLASGSTCVLTDADLRHPGQVDGARLIAQVRTRGVTTISGSPAMFVRLLERLETTGERLDGLRAVFTGGARVPAGLLRRLCERLPTTRVSVVYGSTEAALIAVLDARRDLDALADGERHARGALVGRPVAGIALRIAGGGVGHSVGEVQVRGSHVYPGYWDDPAAAHKMHEGDAIWHRTGDVGFLDEDGRLWLVGRLGEDVAGLWPLPVEGAAELLPFVRRAALVAVAGEPVLCCELTDAPSDWDARVEDATGLQPVALARIPVDPRHNAKVDRPALVTLLTG